jgi:hypothetical protein
MTDFRVFLTQKIVLKLLTELVPFETSECNTKEEYDAWIKRGIKKWSSMSKDTLLGKLFNKELKGEYINAYKINNEMSKYIDNDEGTKNVLKIERLLNEPEIPISKPIGCEPTKLIKFLEPLEEELQGNESESTTESTDDKSSSDEDYSLNFDTDSSDDNCDNDLWDDLDCEETIDEFIDNIIF